MFPFPWCSRSNHLSSSYFPFKKNNSLLFSSFSLSFLSCLLFFGPQCQAVKALCLLAATCRAVLGAHVPWQSGWPESCSNTALCLVIPSCAVSVPRTFSAFIGHIITSPHVAELPVGLSESHGVQRPADEECLPASSSYEAIMLEERFRGSSTSFQMPVFLVLTRPLVLM